MPSALSVNAVAKLFNARLRPISAFFELTYRCNLRCRHCLIDHDPGEMSYDQVLHVLDVLRDLGSVYLALTGGEPFTRSDFLDILRAAKKRRFAVRILTNATLIDEPVASQLGEIGGLHIEISLLAATASTYEMITGLSDALPRVKAAVHLLRANDLQVVAKSPLLSLNFHERHAIVELAQSLGAHWRGFDPVLIPTIRGDVGPLDYALTHEQLVEHYSEEFLQGRAPQHPPSIHPLDETRVCYAGVSVVGVTPDGRLTPCGGYRLSGVDLFAEGVDPRAVWAQHPDFVQARNLRLADMEGCEDCASMAWCSRCPAVSLVLNGTIRRGAPCYCSPAKAFQEAYQRLQGTTAST